MAKQIEGLNEKYVRDNYERLCEIESRVLRSGNQKDIASVKNVLETFRISVDLSRPINLNKEVEEFIDRGVKSRENSERANLSFFDSYLQVIAVDVNQTFTRRSRGQ